MATALSAVPTTNADAKAPPAKAWILVDVDTGRVIDGSATHTPMPPASLSKLLTALTAVRVLPATAQVPVSARATAAPAHDVGMMVGTTWSLNNTLHALLMTSANDAAVALAERVSGNLGAYRGAAAQTATRLGLVDHPVIRDPAGLDDSDSVGGGNLVSARDLAIAARAVLVSPTLAPMVAKRSYDLWGPKGIKFKLVNHNKLLQRYAGTIGVKTGYTRKAGGCLITAATRKGRTMLTVVLGTQDIYGATTSLLDLGFATRVSQEPLADRLPALPAGAHIVTKLRAKPVGSTIRSKVSITALLVAPFGLALLVKSRRRAHRRAVRRRRRR